MLLATASRCSAACANECVDEPNPRIPPALGLPDLLTGAQREGVEYRCALRRCAASAGAELSVFSRTNYSIPTIRRTTDLSSTTSRSRSTAGSLEWCGRRLTRAHLEETTGSRHSVWGVRITTPTTPLVYYNRAWVPFLESPWPKPAHSLGRAGEGVRRGTARHCSRSASPQEMEEGSLRIDANVRCASPVLLSSARRGSQEPQLSALVVCASIDYEPNSMGR